jgi:signal peptidase II
MAEPDTISQPGSRAAAASVPAPSAAPIAAVRPRIGTVATRLLLAALIVVADLWSKSAVFAWLEAANRSGSLARDVHGHSRFALLGDWLGFMLSTNPGAAFGQLQSFPYLLVIGRCVAAVFLVWLLVRTPAGRPFYTGALVLVLGGALGNLYDNLFLDHPHDGHPFGLVRDFIDVYFSGFDWHFPTFNVADSCITTGAVLLLLTSFARDPNGKGEHPPPA